LGEEGGEEGEEGHTPSQIYTSSVAGMLALAYRVSLSSKVASKGFDELCSFIHSFIHSLVHIDTATTLSFFSWGLTFLPFKKLTVSNVFCMSGILSLNPVRRRWVFASIN